jgi:phosphoglycerate dehydrogenase-like enzyme/predicted dehydrogenase
VTRLLLVGAGKIAGAAHLPALGILRDEGLVDVVVWDVDGARTAALAPEWEVATGSSWVDAAAGVDAVAVCVPPGPNADVATEAAARGFHVLCEKPPGRNAAQARRMAEAATGDRVTMLGFNRRSAAIYRDAMARSLALGPPTTFVGRMARGAMGKAPSDTAADWMTSDSSHALDLAIAAMGMPDAVSVARRSVGSTVDNVWTLQLHTPAGSAVLVLHYAAATRTEHYEWIGPGYDVAMEFPTDVTWTELGRPPERSTLERPRSGTTEYAEAFGFVDEYRTFLAAVRGEVPPPAWDFAYGARFMDLVQLVLETPTGTLRRFEPAARASTAPVAGATPRDGDRRPTVLVHHGHAAQRRFFSPDQLQSLAEYADVVTWTDADGPAALARADVLVTGRGAPPPPDLVAGAPQLRLLVSLGASVRQYEPAALVERDVLITNTADAVAVGVAEHCLMVTLAGLRRLTEIDAEMHKGEWPRPGRRAGAGGSALRRLVPTSVKRRVLALRTRGGTRGAGGGAPRTGASDLRGARIGLVGWGHVARRFAELLAPFGCDVMVFSESVDPAELAAAGVRPAGLAEVLASAKVVSLHRGLSDATRGFIDRTQLARIQPGAVLVNTARGGLVEEDALLKRLGRGDLVAAIDVFEEEPLPRSHPLRTHPNAILTPHNAGTTAQEETRMGEQALRTVRDWLEGRPVDAIGADRLERMT